MLTRARTLLSRVFSLDAPPSQTRLEDVFDDDVNDESSDDNDTENNADDDDIENSINDAEHDDGLSDSGDEWPNDAALKTSSRSKGKYQRQINECPVDSLPKCSANFVRPHEKSKQSRLISAMQIATSRCNVEAMKRMLTNFEIDINHRDQYGMSYLEHAILMGSFDMVDLLIRYGCDLYQGKR